MINFSQICIGLWKFLISKMAVKMNLTIITKNHAAYPKIGKIFAKSISKSNGCVTAMPTALNLIWESEPQILRHLEGIISDKSSNSTLGQEWSSRWRHVFEIFVHFGLVGVFGKYFALPRRQEHEFSIVYPRTLAASKTPFAFYQIMIWKLFHQLYFLTSW